MNKKVVVIGGGFAGLSCAYYLNKAGFDVVILEREDQLGGLARGIKFDGWHWSLEKAVHHLFSNDSDIIRFAKDTGFFKNLFFKRPLTGYLYKINGKIRIYTLDSSLSFLFFPLLDLLSKFRGGLSLLLLRFSPHFSWFKKVVSIKFIKKTMGEKVYVMLWKPLFRKKFGKYAGKVVLSFFWARITKRTAKLGYFKGGFQSFIDYLAKKLSGSGVLILTKTEVSAVNKKQNYFSIEYKKNGKSKTIVADYVVCALQAPIFLKLTEAILPEEYKLKLRSIKYLNAVSLILETDKPIVNDYYWLNNAVADFDFTVFIQHTNYISQNHYGGKHLAYVGWYCDFKDPIWQFNSGSQVLAHIEPYLKEINPNFDKSKARTALFKAVFAQPIFDKKFAELNLSYKTPIERLYFAGFELSFPYDRGTNYAVKVGVETAKHIIQSVFSYNKDKSISSKSK
ncbi:MAG: oxidoreductase [Patescibacteria group bacterium]|nr:MAG: oxidoreductase [Patescibacteria group bacterium]